MAVGRHEGAWIVDANRRKLENPEQHPYAYIWSRMSVIEEGPWRSSSGYSGQHRTTQMTATQLRWSDRARYVGGTVHFFFLSFSVQNAQVATVRICACPEEALKA